MPRNNNQLPAGEPLNPLGDEFAFAVAKYAWSEGLTANAIVRKLGLDSTPLHLMQVKRALKRAGQFLSFIPPEKQALAEQLGEKVNANRKKGMRFSVVKDSVPGIPEGALSGVVSARAADLVAKIILEEARTAPPTDEPNVVICNAGGRTISGLVRSLLRSSHVLAESEKEIDRLRARLMFVAGNAAYLPDRFNQSAGFLSVTMAELFGAEHRALPMDRSERSLAEYRAIVKKTALFICGVGTPITGLIWEHFKVQGLAMPKAVVGDIAFNLLDRAGVEVELPGRIRDFMATVNPGLKLSTIQGIAVEKRVLLVLDGDPPEAKTEIGVAALRGRYPTDVVLGSTLARAILKQYRPE